MNHYDEFIKLLQQILNQEPKMLVNEKDTQQAILEMEVMELVGD